MSILTRLFGNRERREAHPVFGRILLVRAKRGSYWEAEAITGNETLSVSIEIADEELPTEAQVHFYQRLATNPDVAFAASAPLLVAEYEKWLRQPFPDRWQVAFKFVGMSVPLAGLESNPWDLAFDCLTDKSGHMFTCYFVDGAPSYVTIDG